MMTRERVNLEYLAPRGCMVSIRAYCCYRCLKQEAAAESLDDWAWFTGLWPDRQGAWFCAVCASDVRAAAEPEEV